MTTEPVSWETMNALVETTAEARNVIREVHGLLKDMRHEIKEGKAIRDHLTAYVHDAVVDVGSKAIEQLQEILNDKILRATETTPICIRCSACGELIALAVINGEENICGACGHKFRIRARPGGAQPA